MFVVDLVFEELAVVFLSLAPCAEVLVYVLPAVGLEYCAVDVEDHEFDCHCKIALCVTVLKRVAGRLNTVAFVVLVK